MTSAGKAVARIETARPAMIFVACPVIEALAIFFTGRYVVPWVKISVMWVMRPVTARPTSAQMKMSNAPIVCVPTVMPAPNSACATK